MPDPAYPQPYTTAYSTSHDTTTTALPPPITEPFTTLAELAVWVQQPEIPADQVAFATKVLEATAVVIRNAGSIWWTAANIPAQAKLIADLKAKNFYQHPTGAVSETVGPLSERFLDEVVHQLTLTEEEQQLLASLATTDDPEPVVPGLWALSTARGPLETHNLREVEVIHVPYWRGSSKAIPYYTAGELGSPW